MVNIDRMLNNIIGRNSIRGDGFSFNVFNRKEYMKRPEVKEGQRQYQQRPEIKEKIRQYKQEYFQRPEVKERMRQYHQEYIQRPEVKEIVRIRHKEYAQLRRNQEQERNQEKKQERRQMVEQRRMKGLSPAEEKEIEPLFQQSLRILQQKPREKVKEDETSKGMAWAKEKTNYEDIDIEPMQKERYSFLGKRKVYMTPQHFLDNARLAQIGFEFTRPGMDMGKGRETRFFEKPEVFEQLYDETNPEQIDYLKRKIASKSTKVHLPYIIFKGHLPVDVEGRHRALDAKQLGIKKMPVIILTENNNLPEKGIGAVKKRQLNPKRTYEQIRGKYYASKDVEKGKEEGMTSLFSDEQPKSDNNSKQTVPIKKAPFVTVYHGTKFANYVKKEGLKPSYLITEPIENYGWPEGFVEDVPRSSAARWKKRRDMPKEKKGSHEAYDPRYIYMTPDISDASRYVLNRGPKGGLFGPTEKSPGVLAIKLSKKEYQEGLKRGWAHNPEVGRKYKEIVLRKKRISPQRIQIIPQSEAEIRGEKFIRKKIIEKGDLSVPPGAKYRYYHREDMKNEKEKGEEAYRHTFNDIPISDEVLKPAKPVFIEKYIVPQWIKEARNTRDETKQSKEPKSDNTTKQFQYRVMPIIDLRCYK